MKIFLQDREGKNHELSINDFIKNQKNLGFKDVSKDAAREILESMFSDMLDNIKKNDEISTVMIEADTNDVPIDVIIFQQFMSYHSNKLTDIICSRKLNPKYVKTTSNPAISPITYYNMIKSKDDTLIIKGFAYCNIPNKDEIFVATVCGTGGTAKIFDVIMDNIVNKDFEFNSPKFISLNSIENPDTINFYTKLGFRKTDKEAESIIREMFKSNVKTFEEFVKEGKKIVGGDMFLFPPTPDGVKYLKKKKCNLIYNPQEWFYIIKDAKKDGKDINFVLEKFKEDKLEGAGIGSFFRDKFSRYIEQPLKNIVSNKYKFNNTSSKTINEYGDNEIVELKIMRTPINSMIDKALNFLSFNKWDSLKKKYGFDQLFHLSLVATVKDGDNLKNIIMEKNEVVNVSTDYRTSPKTQLFNLPKINKKITVRQLLENARQKVGDNLFFLYDAFTNNCQFFIKYLLESSGLMTPEAQNFLFQDISELVKELPSYLPKVARSVTDLGGIVSRLRGDGKDNYELHAVVFRKPIDLDTAKKQAKEFIKGNKNFYRETSQSFRFRNIPKQKFKPKSFRSKKISPDTTLIFGALK